MAELREDLLGFFDGGDGGVLGIEGFLKEAIEREMEERRERGRVVESSEEGLMVLIRDFNEGFADFRDSFEADAKNESAEFCREERSLFSIVLGRKRESVSEGNNFECGIVNTMALNFEVGRLEIPPVY